MNAAILSFHGVTFGYHANKAPVLRQVDFDLQPGRVAAILGPNGAGKTTLLYLALGWLSPWKGEIRLQGKSMHAHTRQERGRRLALVPQTEHTPFDYSVFEYVLMGRASHLPPLGIPAQTDYEATWAALEQIGLADLAEQPVPHLSGGERQLMLLARALAQIAPTNGEAHTSRLLLLDEPSAHLDLSNKARLIGLLRRLRAAGTTQLLTSHEPDVVLALADDVLLIEADGQAQFGPLDEIFTAETLSRLYQMPIRLVEVDGRKQVLWT
jgi:iron complex transport system ATP-binding protein